MAFFPNGQIGPSSLNSNTGGYKASDLNPASFTPEGGTAKGLTYAVNTRKYPSKVGIAGDLQHYMVFFINVREKSKYIGKYPNKKEIKPSGLVLKDPIGGAAKVAGAIGGGALATGLFALIAGNTAGNGWKGKVVKTLGLIGIGGTGYLLGGSDWVADQAKKWFQPQKSYRISDAIMLAVNEKPSVKYGVDYDGKDLGTFIGALSAASAVDVITGPAGDDIARIVALNMAKIPQGIAGALGADLALSDAVQVGMGMAPNPFREQVFRNVDTRTFRFDYKFFPRDVNETNSIKDIIKTFKTHMHPEISEGGLFYVYPSTFDIAYYFNGKENQNIHRISTCVLERMSVDYGGGAWNTFPDGMPTEVNISLEFRELERLTRERIEELDY